MDPPPNPNPNPNVYQIGGVPVEFPYKPYGSQLAFMGRMISTLDRARRQGHCHALLESPTGTGKSLSLLCSSLAWQQHHLKHPRRSLADPPPDPITHGGGFIPETEPSRNPEQPRKPGSNRAKKKKDVPTIFYATRTHSQINQLIREYRKTTYRVPMAILASRKHYCTNTNVCTQASIDEACKLLLKEDRSSGGCLPFRNVNKVKDHPSLQKGGCHEAYDIEDFVKVGRSVKGCSYFAAQDMAVEAQLVFCPYSYIINPIVRRAVDLDIKGSIVILDEAHNIEDMAREAGSVDIEEEALYTLQTELEQLCTVDHLTATYQPLYDVIQGLISWISARSNNLQKHEFEHYSSYWTGDKAMREFQQAGITQQCFPILQECATKAIKDADTEEKGFCLSGISAIPLEGLFSSLGYFFSGNGCHALDYQLALKRYVKRDESNVSSGWRCTLSLWCLNPAIVFKEIADLSISVILTSGTLSPMGSFASELGVQFEACMEAPHVIDVDSQLWAAVISSGPGNCQLNASYKTADGYGFQDALGVSLEEICKVVPDGALVFFPSYNLLEKLRARWCQTGQWSRLNAQKSVYVEPRGTTDDFEHVLKGYYDAILGNNKVVHRKAKRAFKRAHKDLTTKESSQDPIKRGAAFLAVCRGKVSEGINFSDENARVVVIVGVPFPNKNNIQVVLKKKYNDTYKSSKGLLSGSEWYCHQAFRALNQAAGRCIRHRFDYGAIILLDERLKQERNLAYISKWLKKSIKLYDNFEESLEGLKTFFLDPKKQLSRCGKDLLQTELLIPDVNKESLFPLKQNSLYQQIRQKTNQKQKKLDFQNRRKVMNDNVIPQSKDQLDKASRPVEKDDVSPVLLKARCNQNPNTTGEANKKASESHDEYKDLESSSLQHSRLSDRISVEPSMDSLYQTTFVKNTAIEEQKTSQIDNSKDVISYSTDVQSCNKLPEIPSFSVYSTVSDANQSEATWTSTVSPERTVHVESCNPALESSLSNSVNSHIQRKRKAMGSLLKNSPFQIDQFSTLDAESCYSGRTVALSTRERTEPNFTDDCSNCNTGGSTRVLVEDNHTMSPLTADLPIEKELHICCSSCKKSLGLHRNNFLVMCSFTSLSKVYLSYVLKYGPTCSAEQLSKIPRTKTQIVVSDVSSIDRCVLNGSIREGASQHDVWSEEDGCVFRTVSCPFCTESMMCLGVQVLATDASNVNLLNKVLFYVDHLEIRYDEQTPKKEITFPASTNVGQSSGLVEIEAFAYNCQPKISGMSTQVKSKLKLPKREPPSSKYQDGVHR